MQITRRDFRKRIREAMRDKRISFILAIYKVVDELTAEQLKEDGIKLACGKGCSFCCNQLVTCTYGEWEEIRLFVGTRSGERGRLLRKKLRGSNPGWQAYFDSHQEQLRSNPMQAYEDWRGKSCPLLNRDGTCSIYPVRPIDCRTLTSTVKCTRWRDQEGAKRFRFPWESWANSMILEEEERRAGAMSTTPLPHWIYIYQ